MATESTSKESTELIETVIDVNRTTKVTEGGRTFTFKVLAVVGNKKGSVGHGLGRAKEVMEARTKAIQEAKKNMIKIPLKESRTIHHDMKVKKGAGLVLLKSAPAGTGIIAGGTMRAIFDALGIQDIVAKSIRSTNPHNVVNSTFHALKMISSPRKIAERRGKKIGEIYNDNKKNKSDEQLSDTE